MPRLAPLREADEGARRRFDAVDDVFAVFDLAARQPLGHLRAELAPARTVIADEEALHQRAFDQELAVPARAHIGPSYLRLAEPVIGRDRAADDGAGIEREIQHHRVMQHAADIVEEHIDAVRRVLRQLRRERRGVLVLVIDADIEAELARDIVELVGGAGGRDHLAAFELGDLSRDLADRAGGGGDQHRLAGFRLADRVEREIGRRARHAEHAEEIGERQAAELGAIDLLAGLGGQHRMALPAGIGEDDVARREARRARCDDFGDDLAGHHAADLHRRRVGARRAHAAAHIGIEREEERTQHELAVARLRYRRRVEFEIAFADGAAFGPLGEEKTLVCQVGHHRRPVSGAPIIAELGAQIASSWYSISFEMFQR